MTEKFDAVIVGAGPAGLAAAYRLAKEGRRILVLERGGYPGSKNVSGALLHAHGLAKLFPEFEKEAPVERLVTSRRLTFLSPDSSLTMDFKDQHLADPPFHGFTVLRSKFDQWLAGKAEQAGALIMTDAQVDELVREKNRVAGVKVRVDQGEVRADVVIIAEGANSILAEKAGLRKKPGAGEMAVAAKELIKLSPETINERFNLKKNEGASLHFIGESTQGVPGGGFIHTNKDSLSLGLVCRIKELTEKNLKISDLVEGFKNHPHVHPLIKGGEVREYSGHMIPEGGYNSMPRLFAAGVLVAGEAASLNFNNGFMLRGIDYALASGIAAATAVLKAREKNDFSENGLQAYQDELKRSFVLKDLRRFRKLPELMSNARIYSTYPQLLCALGRAVFTTDGGEQKRISAKAWELMTGPGTDVGIWAIIRDLAEMGLKL